MQYMLLIHSSEDGWNALSEAEQNEMYARLRRLHRGIKKSGHCMAGDPLEPTSNGDHRARAGRQDARATDGPFAETKEQLGGYYLIEAKDLDEAIEMGGADPRRALGSIEVRPVACETRPSGRRRVERRLPRGAGARPRDASIRVARRLRPRRGGRAGGVRTPLERWPRDGVPRNPRRLARHDRAATARSTGSAASATLAREDRRCSRGSADAAEAEPTERRCDDAASPTIGCG